MQSTKNIVSRVFLKEQMKYFMERLFEIRCETLIRTKLNHDLNTIL
jgi:hypothetical protein